MPLEIGLPIVNDDERFIDRTSRPRAKDVVLTVLSALFVVAGIFIAFAGGVWPGLVCAAFFGGCVLVGIHEIFGPDAPVAKIAVILGSFAMGVASFAFGYAISRPFSETQVSGGWRGDTSMIFVCMFGGLFFTLGSIAVAVKEIIDRRRIKRQQQWY